MQSDACARSLERRPRQGSRRASRSLAAYTGHHVGWCGLRIPDGATLTVHSASFVLYGRIWIMSSRGFGRNCPPWCVSHHPEDDAVVHVSAPVSLALPSAGGGDVQLRWTTVHDVQSPEPRVDYQTLDADGSICHDYIPIAARRAELDRHIAALTDVARDLERWRDRLPE
ncbi:DUF6907 domain-containing protein [Streptomyces sp. NPDC056672]|uniref:DUF6907 domain-containing protein n=1 Tax=Streptomyces sp. NPDC056672 TaxID=3345906 RepID=UPI0036BBB66C